MLQGPTFFSASLLARRKALGNRLLHVCFSSFDIFADIWKGFHPLVTSTSSIYMFYMSPLSYHALKCPKIRSFFWSVFSCIRTECRKIRTRKNSIFGHFSSSDDYLLYSKVRQYFIRMGFDIFRINSNTLKW